MNVDAECVMHGSSMISWQQKAFIITITITITDCFVHKTGIDPRYLSTQSTENSML
jgi:hypothetical protein